MKTLATVLALALLTCVGCRTARKVQVIADRVGEHRIFHQRLNDREMAAVHAAVGQTVPTIPQPPITMDTRYASVCPYCDNVNLSQTVISSGGMAVKAGQPIEVIIRLGIRTNIVAAVDGNLEHWSMTYVCYVCDMPYGDQRDQLVPYTKSVRLPIMSQAAASE